MAKKILYGIVFVALVIGFWNLFEFLYDLIFTHTAYQFSAGTDLMIPLCVGVTVYLVMFAVGTLKKK